MIKEETARAQPKASTCEWRQQESYTYDADRMLRTETRPDSVQIVRTPDSGGRLHTVQIPGGMLDYNFYPAGTASGAGKMSDVLGPYGVNVHFAYDGMLTTSIAWSGDVTGSVSWQYNSDFNKILETVNGANGSAQAAFGYDADQLLTCASPTTCNPAGSDALKLARNTAGLITNIALGNTSETVTYNTFGELATQAASYTAPSTSLVNITYDAPGFERDKLGRVVQKTEVIGGVTKVYGYTYDHLRRLTDVRVNGTVEEHFEYDANGNRTVGFNATAGTTYTGTYDDQDRLLSYGPFDYTYTANGEIETKRNRNSAEEWILAYDVLGNLLSVGLPNGDLVEYLVDGIGRRVGKKKNGVLLKQWIYHDALKPVAELDGSGNLVSEFVYGSKSNVPDYVRRGSATYRVISDQLGSPRYVVNIANASDVPFTASYTSFGVVTGSGLDWMPFGFAGGMYDGDSGLVRFWRRDLDAVMGRWTSKDPIRFGARQANLFAYINNDPVNRVDPLGLAGFGVTAGGSAEAGAGALGAGFTAGAGAGLFLNDATGDVTSGLYGDLGTFAGTASSGPAYPSSSTHSVAGAAAGVGAGCFFTNADTVNDLTGYFDTFSLNTPFFSAQYATGGGIWSIAITFGLGRGLSGSGYATNTWTWP